MLCGAGKLPKTVLEKGMKPFGDPIERLGMLSPIARI
jgi:hypothetical protein